MPNVTVYDEHHRPLIGVEVEEYSLDTGGTIALATSSLSGIASFPDTSLNVHFRPRVTRRSGKVGELAHNGLVEIHRPLPVVEEPVEIPPPLGWFLANRTYNGGDFYPYMADDPFFRDAVCLIEGNGSFTATDMTVVEIAPVLAIPIATYDLLGNFLGFVTPESLGIYAVWKTGPHPSLTGGNIKATFMLAAAPATASRGPGAQANPIIASATYAAHDDAYLALPTTVTVSLPTTGTSAMTMLSYSSFLGVVDQETAFGCTGSNGNPSAHLFGYRRGPDTSDFGFTFTPAHFLGQSNAYDFHGGAVTLRKNWT